MTLHYGGATLPYPYPKSYRQGVVPHHCIVIHAVSEEFIKSFKLDEYFYTMSELAKWLLSICQHEKYYNAYYYDPTRHILSHRKMCD